MFFDPYLALFAFGVGILGAMFGGIQTFICTGFAGIVVYALKAAGVEPTLLGDSVLNTLLLPAIIFNAAAVATAVAARKYPEVKGWDITRSLIFTHDTSLMLVGGAAGMAGYLLFSLLSYIGIPGDAGSLAIVIIGVLVRLTLSTGRKWNPDATQYYREQGWQYWLFQTVTGVAVATVFALLLHDAGPTFYGVGFSISAVLLLFGYAGDGQKVPTTHQITNIVGVTLGLTGGNVALAILFGCISNIVYLLVAKYFNEDCSTHVDGPAVAIFLSSMVLNLIF